jgi:hypothetical protein
MIEYKTGLSEMQGRLMFQERKIGANHQRHHGPNNKAALQRTAVLTLSAGLGTLSNSFFSSPLSS